MGAATFSVVNTGSLPSRNAQPDSAGALLTQSPTTFGSYAVVPGAITMSSSYATGGDSLSLVPSGLKKVVGTLHFAQDLGFWGGKTGYSFEVAGTPSDPLVKVYATNNTEVANATNLSTVVFLVLLVGYR